MNSVIEKENQTISPGVTQISREIWSPSGKQQVHILEVNKSDRKLFFEAGLTYGKVIGMQKTTEQATAISRPDHQVIGAINGDFYNMTNGLPANIMIHKGEIITGPNNRAAVGFRRDGTAIIDVPQLSITVKVNHKQKLIPCSITVNKDVKEDSLVLFSPVFGDALKLDGDEGCVFIQVQAGAIRSGQSIKGRVIRFKEESTVSFKEGMLALVGHGSGKEWLSHLRQGDQIELSFSLSNGWNDVVEAIGGNHLLVKEGAIPTSVARLNEGTAPRTAVGVRSDGTILLLVIEGRDPGVSEGVTIKELADIFIELGVKSAVNLDGGGSSTMLARLPGDKELSIVNKTSDGAEREVANSLLLISAKKEGPLEQLIITPQKLLILAGSTYSFSVKGVDAAYHPKVIDHEVYWSVHGQIGDITKDGHFIASPHPGVGSITAKSGNVNGKTSTIEVVDQVDELTFLQPELTVDPDSIYQVEVVAFCQGRKVAFDPAQLDWCYSGTGGKIDSTGRFMATSDKGKGTITVQYRNVQASIQVEIGKEPNLLEDFENGIDHWSISGDRYTAIHMRLASLPDDPVRFGRHALRIDYNFLYKKGISGVYAAPDQMIELEGYPEKIAMWVYGDGNGHWLRAQLRDGMNQSFVIDFTDNVSGIDWKGWKLVEAPIPKGKVLPLKLAIPFRYMATKDEQKTTGTLYIDQIHAIYGQNVKVT